MIGVDDRARQALYTVAAILAMGVAIAMTAQAWSAGVEYDRRRRRDASDLLAANDELRARVQRLEEERPDLDHEETRRHDGERGES